MELNNLGYSGGGGILGAVLTYLGFKQRIDDLKQDLDEHKKQVVYKDTCEVCASNINKKLDLLIDFHLKEGRE